MDGEVEVALSGLLVGGLIGLLLGIYVGFTLMESRYRKEAASRNYAEWVVTNDSGTVEWRWIEPEEAK